MRLHLGRSDPHTGPRHRPAPPDERPGQMVLAPDTMAWALFQPNAPGSWELCGAEAIAQRQLLKGTGRYESERVFIAVRPDEVSMWAVLPRRFVGRRLGTWSRGALSGRIVLPNGPADADWPAFLLCDRALSRPIAEVRSVLDDFGSREVARLLCGDPDWSTDRPPLGSQ